MNWSIASLHFSLRVGKIPLATFSEYSSSYIQLNPPNSYRYGQNKIVWIMRNTNQPNDNTLVVVYVTWIVPLFLLYSSMKWKWTFISAVRSCKIDLIPHYMFFITMQRPFVPGLRYSGTAGWIEFVGSAVATIFTLVRDPLAVMNNILIQCHPENIVEVSVAATPCCLLFSAPMIYCVEEKNHHL